MERKIIHPRRSRPATRQGFALIVTISLMVLLTIIAVGLLSLSAISLRTSSTSAAREEAMANARLALLVALGDLQRAAGPDQRITAPGEMVDPDAPRGLVGVWKGTQFSSDHLSVSKTASGQFVRWMVSDSDPRRLEKPTSVPQAQAPVAILVGDGSLGPKPKPNEQLEAGIVEVHHKPAHLQNTKMKSSGGFAYAVLDESFKARANLDPKPLPFDVVANQARIGEANRFGIEAIDRIDSAGFPWWTSAGQDKLITLPTGLLLDNTPPVDEFTYDLTTWSRGLLTDAASGGLRKDLSVMFENLPDSYARARVYEDSAAARAPSNPYWKHLAGYANLYKEVEPGDGGYKLTAAVPPGYRPYAGGTNGRALRVTPAAFRGGYPAMPAVTKLQMVFSIIARNAHGGWPGRIRNATGDPNKKYMLHMIYSPIITVYNPYNIPLEFNSLKLTFANVPIGFQFYVNGRAQTTSAAPLNQLYVNKDGDSTQTKEFNVELVSDLGSNSSAASIILQPGESKVFGTSISPDWSWAKDRPGDGGTMFDWRSDKTGKIKVAPGWNTAGVGFDIDWLIPRPLKSGSAKMGGVLPLASNDRVDVAFQPMSNEASNNKFSATIDLTVGRRNYPAGVIEFDYGSTTVLTKFLTDRYENDVKFPARLERPTVTNRVYEADATMLKNYKRVLPFAIFSFYNKTTLESGSAAKPGVCHPPTTLITKMDAKKEDPAIHSYEVSMLPVRNAGAGNAGAIEIDPRDRGYSFTGHSLGTGVRMAPLFEAPVLPLQSLAQLRHANLAASGHLPNFTYTVGESWASPLIPRGSVDVPRGAQGYTYLDHTWLANTMLWDSSFFSTICPYEGTAFSGSNSLSMSQVLKSFLNGDKPLLNSRLSPYLPPGVTASDLAGDLDKDDDFYAKSAAYLWVEGPFNINSTSVEAWKTVLGALHKAEVDTYDPIAQEGGGGAPSYDDEASPVPRVRRPAGPAIDDRRGTREERWRGYHTLDNKQIEQLAESIVEEIKERGPFLSLAEFVNRNPSGGIEQALKGPLQTAIDNSGVNAMFRPDSRDIPLNEASADGFAFPEAMAGENAAGAPGYLTQGDILSMLGTTPTVRGDTFRIRAYGEARQGGKIIARAWCEAVVQRAHEFVDPADEPSTPIADLSSNANKTFGRRFEVVYFRWLSPEEV